jgi:bifunctional DNase/RNase
MRHHRKALLAAAALSIALAPLSGCGRHRAAARFTGNQVRVEVAKVGLDSDSGAHYVLLEDLAHARSLEILIGDEEARTIMLEMHGIKPDRPMAHDLLRDIIQETGNHVDRVTIAGVHGQVYYADIYLDRAGLRLDSRPSDAIALAMGTGAPIFVANALFASTARPQEQPGYSRKELPGTFSAHGVVVQDLSPMVAGYFGAPPASGVLVADVSGLAARAGLMRGDIVTAVGRCRVHNNSEFASALSSSRDARLSFTIMRGERPRIIEIPHAATERSIR